MNVESKVLVYELDSKDALPHESTYLKVKNAGTSACLVVIDISELKECKSVTVNSNDLLKAIQNATNQ